MGDYFRHLDETDNGAGAEQLQKSRRNQNQGKKEGNGENLQRRNSRNEIVVKSYDEIVQVWKTRLPDAEIVFIAAQEGAGTEHLLERIVSYVPTGPKYFPADTLTNRDERFFTTGIRVSVRASYFPSFLFCLCVYDCVCV